MPKKKFEPRTYPMYEPKELNFGFSVLCHDHSINLARNTIKSIRRRYGEEASIMCIADSSANAAEMKELKEMCPSHKGGNSWSSLINTSMKKTENDWTFIIIAGSFVKPKLQYRFSMFIESDLDILYPLTDGKYKFEEATLNGLFMNKETFKQVGNWSTGNSLPICKLFWSYDAISVGCKFKAISGTKII